MPPKRRASIAGHGATHPSLGSLRPPESADALQKGDRPHSADPRSTLASIQDGEEMTAQPSVVAELPRALSPAPPPRGRRASMPALSVGNLASMHRPVSQQRRLSVTAVMAKAKAAPAKPGMSNEKILQCFKTFDVNGDGTISREELGQVLHMLDKDRKFNPSDVQAVMDEIDTSHDGSIDFAEFTVWLGCDHVTPGSCGLFERAEAVMNEETPQERLERCRKELRKGELAALPPKPIEVLIEESDIWIFTKKEAGINLKQAIDNARTSKEPTLVHQISPTSLIYREGVRKGYHVVVIGQGGTARSISDNTKNVLDKIIAAMGGGGGAQRKTIIGFVSEAALTAQQAAQDALQGLLDNFKSAEEECGKIKPIRADVIPLAVTIQYYHNRVLFPIPDCSLRADKIDEVFGVSSLMPGCTLHLAERCPGDVHIMTSDVIEASAGCGFQKFQQDVIEASVKKEESKSGEDDHMRGAFVGLKANQTYFLIVDPGETTADEEWRAKQQRSQEEERVAALPEHDCEKERVAFGLHVETELGEFKIEIDNREGRNLGMNTAPDNDGMALRVEDVLGLGLICIWNTLHPDKVVKHGDRIVAINAERGNAAVLADELKKHDSLQIQILRADFEIGDSVQGLFQNGNWYNAKIVKDNFDGTFSLQWSDGRAEDKIKGPFELRKTDAMQEQCHTCVDGDYWFIGSHNGRVMYKNGVGGIISFHKAWRIGLSEESSHCWYSAPGETGMKPPSMAWPSPLNPGKVAHTSYTSGRVCRICTLPVYRDGPPADAHT